MKKILILFTFILITTPTLSVGKSNYLSSEFTDLSDEHLIQGVPYVGQDKNLFCNLACFTMVLKYYGINATFEEVLYFIGNGYYQMYFDYDEYKSFQRVSAHLPYALPGNYKFLAEQYGLSYEPWETNISVSFEDRWNHDWPRIKENISNNSPVIFKVDEVILLFDYLGFKNIEDFENIIGDPHDHYIVLVGYNKNNNSICIQDPAYLIIDKPELGAYRWTDLDLIKFAHKRITTDVLGASSVFVNIFKKDQNPLSKEEAFLRAHNISIELLKGNTSTYYPDYEGDSLREIFPNHYWGTTGTKKHIQHCSKGLDNRTKTISIYKKHEKFGIIQTLKDILFLCYSKIFPEKNFLEFFKLKNTNFFEYAYFSKQYVTRYLNQAKDFLNDSNLRNLCEYELEMFKSLEKNWEKMGNYYSIFLRRGIFLSLPRGIILMNKMKGTLEEIVTIEEAIIAGPSGE